MPNGTNDNVTIEYKEFGIRLTLTPTVMNNRRIALKVAPEVSELDYSAGIQSGGWRCRHCVSGAPTPA